MEAGRPMLDQNQNLVESQKPLDSYQSLESNLWVSLLYHHMSLTNINYHATQKLRLTQWCPTEHEWICWWNLWLNKIRFLDTFSIWILIENIVQLFLMFFLQNFIFLEEFYDSTKIGFISKITSYALNNDGKMEMRR